MGGDKKRASQDRRRASKDAGKSAATRRSGDRRKSADRKRSSKDRILDFIRPSSAKTDTPTTDGVSASLRSTRSRKAEDWMKTWKEDEIGKEWEELQKEYTTVPSGFSTSAFDAADAKKKRYAKVKLLDQTRVKLGTGDLARFDFINASFVSRAGGGNRLILAAGPTKDCLTDWWTLIYQQKIAVIVMLCQTTEEGKSKCEPYIPEEKGKPLILKPPVGGAGKPAAKAANGVVKVELEETTTETAPGADEEQIKHSLVKYTYPGKLGEQTRKVDHLQYLTWPDQGVPANALGVAHLRNLMEKVMTAAMEAKKVTPDTPILIHCSAGIGRSGTFAAVDNVLRSIIGMDPTVPSVPEIVRNLRKERFLAVQAPCQYYFIYAATVAILKDLGHFKHNHKIPAIP